MSNRANRPSPIESATWYEAGTYKKGNDGNMYTIGISSNGVHRWVQASFNTVSQHEIFSHKHPKYGQSHLVNGATAISAPKHNYKFNIGDRVVVKTSGLGCGPDEIGIETTIVELGEYGSSPAYRVANPPLGNSKLPNGPVYDFYDGMIDERSFQIVEPKILPTNVITKKTKPVKLQTMARVKSITKRTTKEVRNIETSLINKEEVFKMLALAEATGLPLLLVGDPGVNSN